MHRSELINPRKFVLRVSRLLPVLNHHLDHSIPQFHPQFHHISHKTFKSHSQSRPDSPPATIRRTLLLLHYFSKVNSLGPSYSSSQFSSHQLFTRRNFWTRAEEVRIEVNDKRIEVSDQNSYGYSKERFVWSLISAVGIFCLGAGATIVNGVQNLWTSQHPEHVEYAALVIGGSFVIESVSLVVAINAVKKGAAAEGMKLRDYIWRGHDPTAVAVMTEDCAAVSGLAIAAASLIAVHVTGNAIYDAIGSIVVGNLLGMVAIFLIQRNRRALIGRAIDDHDMEKVMHFLKNDPVVDSLYDCKSEVIGPGFFRFKAEIDFNGVVLVQNYINRAGSRAWARQFRKAMRKKDNAALLMVMSTYGEEIVTALGNEVDRLEKEIKKIVPGIQHVDIEAHNPINP